MFVGTMAFRDLRGHLIACFILHTAEAMSIQQTYHIPASSSSVPSALTRDPLYPIHLHLSTHRRPPPSIPLNQRPRASPPQPLSKDPQPHHRRHPHRHGHKPQQTTPPPIPQRLVKIRREKREPEPRHAPRARHGRQRARRVRPVRLHQVAGDALEGDGGAGGEDCDAHVRAHPVGVVGGGPGVDEDAGRGEDGAEEEQRDAVFGFSWLGGGEAGLQGGVDLRDGVSEIVGGGKRRPRVRPRGFEGRLEV